MTRRLNAAERIVLAAAAKPDGRPLRERLAHRLPGAQASRALRRLSRIGLLQFNGLTAIYEPAAPGGRERSSYPHHGGHATRGCKRGAVP